MAKLNQIHMFTKSSKHTQNKHVYNINIFGILNSANT